MAGIKLDMSSKTATGGTAMLKIGEFSKLSRVSVRMLRHYDEIGLLKPAEIDRFTDYRYYRGPAPYSGTHCRPEGYGGFSCGYRQDP